MLLSIKMDFLYHQTMIMWIYIVILAHITVSTIATNHPKLTLSPSDSEVVHYVNDSHIVNCNAYNTTRVRWLNPKQTVIEETKGRIHIEERPGGSTALVFETITLQDKGEWSCQGEIGDVQRSFNMVINQPISFVDTPVVQSAREDRYAVIRCMVTADPEPTISWYYNGQILNLPTEKYIKVVDGLAITKVSKNDSGEYTCKAFQISTTISNVKERTIRLNIQHIPIRPQQKASADVQFGYLYGIVNLTCEAEAEPAAEFTWYRDNKKLSPNVHLIHSEGHESILQILVNDSKAFGEYKCKAENELGTLERVITLSQGVKPEKPTNLALRGVNSDTFDVDVGAVRKTKKRDPMDVNGYRFEIIESEKFRLSGRKWDNARVMILGFEDGITYLINNLSANTSYLVRVASRNPAGLSDWTGPREFHTTPKEPLGLMPTNSQIDNDDEEAEPQSNKIDVDDESSTDVQPTNQKVTAEQVLNKMETDETKVLSNEQLKRYVLLQQVRALMFQHLNSIENGKNVKIDFIGFKEDVEGDDSHVAKP